MKIKKIILFACIAFLINCSHSQTVSPILEPSKFAEKIKSTPQAIILDVRTPGEYHEGHIPNAVNYDWKNSTAFNDSIARLDKNSPVMVYCLAGVRSNAAVAFMEKLGFKNLVELKGGFRNWESSKLPEEKD